MLFEGVSQRLCRRCFYRIRGVKLRKLAKRGPARATSVESAQRTDDLQTLDDVSRTPQGAGDQGSRRVRFSPHAQREDGAHPHFGKRVLERAEQLLPVRPAAHFGDGSSAQRAPARVVRHLREAIEAVDVAF